jgi:hypothetical protein
VLQTERALRSRNQRLRIFFFVWARGAVAPNWVGPGRVADRACDDMQVKLADDVAKRAKVDLVRLR